MTVSGYSDTDSRSPAFLMTSIGYSDTTKGITCFFADDTSALTCLADGSEWLQ